MTEKKHFTGRISEGNFIVIGNFVEAYQYLKETLKEAGYFDGGVQGQTTEPGLIIPKEYEHMRDTFYELGMSQEEVDDFVDFAAKYEAHLNRKQK